MIHNSKKIYYLISNNHQVEIMEKENKIQTTHKLDYFDFLSFSLPVFLIFSIYFLQAILPGIYILSLLLFMLFISTLIGFPCAKIFNNWSDISNFEKISSCWLFSLLIVLGTSFAFYIISLILKFYAISDVFLFNLFLPILFLLN